MTEIEFRTATALARSIREKEIGSLELLDHYLERVERLNPKINAVVTLDVERARQRAREADDATARGESWGPLHGLPMTIKDAIETAGLRTTSGAPELAEHVPDRDADAVALLRSAGAVIFGKTNLPTYAMDHQSYNPVFGTTSNPWDVSRSPGGSSGGAAAAVAAGLAGLELGSDIGGSIRVPSHWCGVYGIKPTYGVVPARGHIPGPPGALTPKDIAALGPIGRSADDLELALGVLASPTQEDAIAWRIELPPPRHDRLASYRVAAWLDDADYPTDAEVLRALSTAVDALRGAGVTVDDAARPGFSLSESDDVYQTLLLGAVSPGFPEPVFEMSKQAADMPPGPDEPLMVRAGRALAQRHRDWLRTNERRHHIRAAWKRFFEDFDVLLCPAASVAAIPHDHSEDTTSRTITINGEPHSYWALTVWPGLASAPYLPGVVAPVGRTSQGLPVGIQIVAPYLEDRTAIDVARRLAEVTGGYEPPPGF